MFNIPMCLCIFRLYIQAPLAQMWHCGDSKFKFWRTKHNVNSDPSKNIKHQSCIQLQPLHQKHSFSCRHWHILMQKCVKIPPTFLICFFRATGKAQEEDCRKKKYCLNRLTIQSSYFFQKENKKNPSSCSNIATFIWRFTRPAFCSLQPRALSRVKNMKCSDKWTSTTWLF